MKLHELVRQNEGVAYTVQGDVTSFNQLRGADGEYLVGTMNVAGNVYLYGRGLERLPVQFGSIGGDFYCFNNRLTSLEGAPVTVGGSFSYSNNRLASLEGAPSTIGGDFHCSSNRLTSLEGMPSTISGGFFCNRNRLTTLVGVHKILKRIDGGLHIWGNGIETGGIGLILVEGLTRIAADQPAFGIISKYLGQGNRGVLRCQEALHEANLGKFARI